jgi:uncharacterized membrane protein
MIGVVGVILAAGFFLKLSFDRGWISPFLRCAGGAAAGIALGALGWRLHDRGLRRYGAALIGAGAAVVYLAAWAAARLYGLLPPTTGLVALAAVSLALGAVAYAIEVEWLAAVAALGGLLAPSLLGSRDASPNALLIYVGAMGLGLGWVAAFKSWRIATLVVTLSVVWYGIIALDLRPDPWLHWIYAIVVGGGALAVAIRHRWPESRVLAFGGGWGMLAAADGRLPAHWPTLLGGAGLALPVWLRAWTAPSLLPRWRKEPNELLSASELLYFLLTPILLGWAVARVAPVELAAHPGLAAAIVALPYLGAGWSARRSPFAVVGVVSLLVAAVAEWRGFETIWAALAVTLVMVGIGSRTDRRDARWLALAALGTALVRLVDLTPSVDDPRARPFLGPWFLAVAAAAGASALAAPLWSRPAVSAGERRLGPALWILAGLVVFGGVTHDLEALAYAWTAERGPLLGGLLVSAWWILCAAGLVVGGFRAGLKPLRLAGLGVAALAAAKVLLVDLSQLDALYRVASVLIVGVVFLALAYLYQRRSGKRVELPDLP